MLSNFSSAKSKYFLLPVDLFLVRNGISEGSVVIKRRRNDYQFPPKVLRAFSSVHSSRWRLTQLGQLQARATGRWIAEQHPDAFGAYLTGEYVRSLETSCLLDLPGASWLPSLYLRPRDYGRHSALGGGAGRAQRERVMAARKRDSFYWAPPNGESLAHMKLRIERVMSWIRKNVPSSGAAIVVANKDVLESVRIKIEQISQMDYMEKIIQPPKRHTLHNCSVLQYTRRNPLTGEIVPEYKWMRIATPWLGRRFVPEQFEQIIGKYYSNSELLTEVSNVQRIFPEYS